MEKAYRFLETAVFYRRNTIALKVPSIVARALQYTGIFSNFQYLMHTGRNDYDTGI